MRPGVEHALRFLAPLRVLPWMFVWLLLGVAACGDQRAGASDCTALAGLERDGCIHARVQRASDAVEVFTLAPTIDDVLVRDAALIQWVSAHRKALPQRDGQAICALLSSREQNACSRRLNAPHLSR